MEITPNSSTSQVTVTTSAAAIRSWAVGQLLNAVAMEGAEAGLVSLRVGNANVTAQVPFAVKTGQSFVLEVISLGDLPVLQIVRQAAGADPSQAVLRAALPRQSDLPPLLANLAALADGSGGLAAERLPGQVAQVLRALMDALSKSNDVATGQGLKRAFRNSGVLLESKLAREAGRQGDIQRAATATDFKAGLLRLRAALRNAEPPAPASARPQAEGDSAATSPASSAARPASSSQAGNTAPTAPESPKTTQTIATRLPLPDQTGDTPAAARPASSSQAENTAPTAPEAPKTNEAAVSRPPMTGQMRDTPAAARPTSSSQAENTAPTAPEAPKTNAAAATRLPMAGQMRDTTPAAAETTEPTSQQSGRAARTAPTGTTPNSSTPATAARSSAPLLPPLQDFRPQPQASVQSGLTAWEQPAQTVATLLNQVEGALARTHLTQLASHTAAADGRQVWLAEIPVRQGSRVDVFQARIERDEPSSKKGQTAGDSPWSMELAFDLPGLGPVHARVGVLADKASTTFWAEQAGTAQLFNRHLAELRQRFEAAGLVADRLLCHAGRPSTQTRSPTGDQSLLDEEA